MKSLGAYNNIVEVAKCQIFARVPKEHLLEFKAYAFENNAARFSMQSICMVLMAAGILILYLIRLPVYEPPGIHIILLVCKMILMGIVSYFLARIVRSTYNHSNYFHKSLDILFPAIYIVSDVLVCFTGPHSIGNYMRLFAIPIIVGSITVINQIKSASILCIVYVIYFFMLPRMTGVASLPPFASSYNFWFVVFATTAFLSASVYSQFLNNFLITRQLKQTSDEYSLLNAILEQEINQRTKLLQTVNSLSSELFGSSNEVFVSKIYHGMGTIGAALNVDRIHIWKKEPENEENEFVCSQIFKWTNNAQSAKQNEIKQIESIPDVWIRSLLNNGCINGIVRSYSGVEREYLISQGISSTIVVPVFILNEFWGFIGFDDCEDERIFREIEETILRTISMLLATSILGNEMIGNLVSTTEMALAASKSKSDFLANISHEIRTPLNAITGMANIAYRSESLEEIHNCLDRINAAGLQLLSIINDVLDMSKIEAGKIEMEEKVFDFEAMLHNVKSIIRTQVDQKQLHLITEFSPDLPKVVIGDETRLSQVLINLLSNAVKFTPKDGSVFFTVCTEESQQEDIERLCFTVRDTGIGMSKETLPKLFNKFEQADASISRRFGGTGLGLAITKRIVEMMQGNIEVESVLNEGSCFTVHVLMHKGDMTMLSPRKSDEAVQFKDIFKEYNVLLAEDIEINYEIILAMLADTGINIDVAQNGKFAVEAFESNPDKYDLVFMDIQMPIMDGYTATETIRALPFTRAKSIPILAMSANAFAEDIKHCLDCGMNDHIAKPIDYLKLINMIKKYAKMG